MRTKITLPVIRRLGIRNYSLYPGANGQGLDLEFPAGVTVLAGINGVGKTTLLNLLMRMLLGPTERGKGDRDLGRVSQRELVVDRNFSFFADRVPEKLDDNATATLEYLIGEREYSVTRYLKTMALKSLKLRDRTISSITSEIDFGKEMARQTGLPTHYDFHVVVRFLQFFTEERQPILWSAATQYEFFKTLFLDPTLTKVTDDAFRAIHRIDSDYRNRRNQLNLRIKRLEEAKAKTPVAADLAVLQAQIAAAKVSSDEAGIKYREEQEIVDGLQLRARELDNKLNLLEGTLADLEDELENADAAFVAQALPSLEDKAKFLMAGLSSGQGCFVCGNRHKGQLETVQKQLKGGQCFVCEHPIAGRGTGAKVRPLAAAQVRSLEQRINGLIAQTTQAESERDELYRKLSTKLKTLSAAAALKSQTATNLATLQARLPAFEDASSTLEAELAAEEIALEVLSDDRKKLADSYREQIRRGRVEIEGFKETLRTTFTSYAEAFLQEKVDVSFGAQDKVMIATGAGQVGMPAFSIAMTSSTHQAPKERLRSDNVSESQKEFLDLAFRVTLLDMACADGSKSLVIETPEASLDSWFMLRAAELMRQFAPADQPPVRNLIATSNLNGTDMIPALLGQLDKNGKVRRKTNGANLVDLMKLTASSNTLKEGAARVKLEQELRRVNG
ncbi:AAA family ATPase [Diaphorobacter caeni]|uniref:AAA family ATPase n=1 Tax=Diaphorobacter caeni TaxID=2784387 RepID=UPI00188F523C|nr:AAA family ATPase [Diaphorobacter caeni]MBF5004718.1 AAA family ATPase [Diaphorobacter caeni]